MTMHNEIEGGLGVLLNLMNLSDQEIVATSLQ
jgi:hypothetical protein